MARKKTAAETGAYLAQAARKHRFCAVEYPKGMQPGGAPIKDERTRLLRETQYKWLNGTKLRYWFFPKPKAWAGSDADRNVVRQAFAAWKALGIGLDFEEVQAREQADVRIAFLDGDGSWSYIGTDVLTKRDDPRTMNFGWSLTEDLAEGMDTALHEIGHTLGFPHEHQNPFAGIVWNEAAVYKTLGAPPNNWSKATTRHNIIDKLQADKVQGSSWDPNSVMHYPFEAGLIVEPKKYAKGLTPKGGLSARDRKWARGFYPPVKAQAAKELQPFKANALYLATGQQADFRFKPIETRDYEFRTFGEADALMALYAQAKPAGKPLAQEDDGGTEDNAHLKVHLAAGQEYVLRLRLRYAKQPGQAAVMVW
ncbi:matrixin family metalloprotease [Ramlibacter agri]|nr:matrixin family metalloprotease [Ramlibacter agri]